MADPLIPASMPSREKTRRVIAFLIDDMSMDAQKLNATSNSLVQFVKTKMQPHDLGALMLTNRSTMELQLYSSDQRQLRGMIRNLRPKMKLPGMGIPQMTAISKCIKTMKDMPGRKYLYVIPGQALIPHALHPDYGSMAPAINPFNIISDVALRAGIVIYFVCDGRPTTAPNYGGVGGLDRSTGDPILPGFDLLEAEHERVKNIEINPLPQKTGGDFIVDVADASNQQKGYYQLSYTPPADTFNSGNRGIYRKVKDDLKVNLASGYTANSPSEYLLRVWMHVNAGGLSVVREKDGTGTITLDTACAASDVNEYAMQGAGIRRYAIRISKGNLDQVRNQGLWFSASFPLKHLGGYFVRAGVPDAGSGKIGSTYQYMEIPDLKKRRPALSSIFIINRDEDASWIHSNIKQASQTELQPDLKRVSKQNPALRIYQSGETIECIALLYNAGTNVQQTPDLVSQYTLLKDGMEYYKSEPEAIKLSRVEDFKEIPIRKKLLLKNSIPPGRYVMLLQITEKKEKQTRTVATQALDFTISERKLTNTTSGRMDAQALSNQ
jgi:hypothetical protein